MTRRRTARTVLGVAVFVVAALAVGFGIVGIPATVSSGGQVEVCGLRVGVTVAEGAVHFAGTEGVHTEGDRVRVAPLCVVEVVRIEVTPSDPDDDGGGALVHLRWRLW